MVLHPSFSVLRWTIAAADDPRIGEYSLVADPAALARAGLFVAEGRFVVARLLAAGRFDVRSVLVNPPAFEALFGDRVDGAAVGIEPAIPVYVAAQSVLDGVVGFNVHRGCLALAERPARRTLDQESATSWTRVLVLEGVNNPDNVGGVFRSAAAFAADAVVLGPGCGDPLYRKAIRTSMAATLQVPFVDAGPWPGGLQILRDAGFRAIALTPSSDARALEELPRDGGRVALLVGSEGHGLTAGALDAATERVRIRMPGTVDSLNVTVAASIAMHRFF